jgi:hypothetical protein
MNKLLVAIDFSINSPALTIKYKDKYSFISFYNSWGRTFDDKIIKSMNIPNEIRNLEGVSVLLYDRNKKTKDYQKDQINGILDAENLSNIILSEITKYNCSELVVGLEGFSYASKGNSAIDLIMYNSFLRKDLFKITSDINIFSPSAIKKIVTKGNANKFDMAECFLDNKLKDESLEKTKFFKWCKKNKNIKAY